MKIVGRLRDWARNLLISISDPALAEIFQIGPGNYSGVTVNESSALASATVYRCVALVAGTVGTLPLDTLRVNNGVQTPLASVFDDPDPGGLTPMSWKETITAHILLHGNAYLQKIYGAVGQVVALKIIHPLFVTIELPDPRAEEQPKGGKWFRVSMIDGTSYRFDANVIEHIMGLSMNGYEGMSVLTAARNGLGTALAADRAAATMFDKGALISGIVTSDDQDFTRKEAKQVKADLDRRMNGWNNAGGIPVVNRKLKFTPWQMTAQDAQFLESRRFQVEEICRWFGVHPSLIGVMGAVSNWGTGVEQQQIGLGRFNLAHITTRIEQTLSRLKASTVSVKFDYSALERPNPQDQIASIIAQINCKDAEGRSLMTIDEGRALLNRPPLPAAQPAIEPAPDPEVAAV